MPPLDTRYFRLYAGHEATPEPIAARLADLAHVVQSLAQDLSVLREMLEQRGLWDEAEYRRLRIERMIADHSSAGPSPWTRYAVFRHTREEDEFLAEELGADEEDRREFRRRAGHAGGLS